jgi:hypothetical protein
VLDVLSKNNAALEKLTLQEQSSLASYLTTIRSNINWVNMWGHPMIEWMEKNPHPPKDVESSGVKNTSILGLLVIVCVSIFRGESM